MKVWIPNLLTASRLLLLLTGGWSMVTLFRDNADLWARVRLAMERR